MIVRRRAPLYLKIAKYHATYVIQEAGPEVLEVFVMESTGCFDQKAEKFIQKIARLAFPGTEDNPDPDGLRSLFTCRFRQRLSVANALGMAAIFQRWIKFCVNGSVVQRGRAAGG